MISPKFILTFLFCFGSTFISFSQDSLVFQKRLYVGLSHSSDYCYRNVSKPGNTEKYKEWGNELFSDKTEIPKYGYSAGLALNYQFTKSLYFESGLVYSHKGYKSIVLIGYQCFSGSVSNRLIYNFNYFEIPLKVNFSLGAKKLQFISGAGIKLNLLSNAFITLDGIPDAASFKPAVAPKDYALSEFYNIKKLNCATVASFGFRYNFSEQVNLKMEAYGQYLLRKESYKSSVNYNLWNMGLNLTFSTAIPYKKKKPQEQTK